MISCWVRSSGWRVRISLKRPDLVGFVNGLPLVLIELKKPGVNVREGFGKNLRDYKQTIPQLFHYNALLLVSNGVAEQDRQPDSGVGAFRRLEEGDKRGGRGGNLAGDAVAWDLRERTLAESHRELHALFRQQRRGEQVVGEEPSVSRSGMTSSC